MTAIPKPSTVAGLPRPGSDPDETGEEHHSRSAGVGSPARAAIGTEVAGDHETRRDKAEEPDAAGDKMQQPLPGHRPRPVGRCGWEAQGRVGDRGYFRLRPGRRRTRRVGGEPKCRRVRRAGPADPDRGCDRHQGRDDEVGDLDPAEPAVGQQAQVVAREVEPLPVRAWTRPTTI